MLFPAISTSFTHFWPGSARKWKKDFALPLWNTNLSFCGNSSKWWLLRCYEFFSLPTTVRGCLKPYSQGLGPFPRNNIDYDSSRSNGNDSLQLIVFNKSYFNRENNQELWNYQSNTITWCLCYGHVYDLGTKSCMLNYCYHYKSSWRDKQLWLGWEICIYSQVVKVKIKRGNVAHLQNMWKNMYVRIKYNLQMPHCKQILLMTWLHYFNFFGFLYQIFSSKL